jgi:hypothetical protein
MKVPSRDGRPLLTDKTLIESPNGDYLGIVPDDTVDQVLSRLSDDPSPFRTTKIVIGKRYDKPVPFPLDPWSASLKAGV